MLLAAAVQLVFGWTKSFPVSIGRPGLRTVGTGARDRRARAARARPRRASTARRAPRAACSARRVVLGRVLDRRAAADARPPRSPRDGAVVNVLIVSGIWPPDVGGPASHAPELAAWLRARGHRVEARDDRRRAARAASRYPVHWVSRRLPPRRPPRGRALALIATRARRADVVYATGDVRPLARRGRARAPSARRRSSPPTRRSSARAAGGSSAADVALPGRRRRAAARVRCGCSATAPSAARRTSSARARTSRTLVVSLARSRRARDACCRTRRPRRPMRIAPTPLGEPPPLAFAGRLTAAKYLDVALEAVRALDGAYARRRRRRPGPRPPRAAARRLGSASASASSARPPRRRCSGSCAARTSMVLPLGVGELPARRRRGARARHARGRDARRRRAGDRRPTARTACSSTAGDVAAFAAAIARYLGDDDAARAAARRGRAVRRELRAATTSTAARADPRRAAAA